MLRLLKQNPLHQWISPLLCQITHTHLPFRPSNLLTTPQTDSSLFTIGFSFFSSLSTNLQQESPKTKQERILDFFHSYGFTETQIKRFIHKCPSVRSIDTIKPKLDHLLAFGFSPFQLIKVIYYGPTILASSLNERIAPNLNLLGATFGSKTDLIKAVIGGPFLLYGNLEKHVIPNLNLLRMNGIPTDKITFLFTRYPLILGKEPNLIAETIDRLKGLGMKPSTVAFIDGMNIMILLKKETLERKMELYRSFGWSEKDTLFAFSTVPTCMTLSDDKITKTFKFFLQNLEWDSEMLLKRPIVLTYSLNGRMIPRCAVLNELAKNGLWNGKPTVYTLLILSAQRFKEAFVDKYEKEAPQVIDAYQGKIDFVGFESTIVASSKS